MLNDELRDYDCDKDTVNHMKAIVEASASPSSYFIDDTLFIPQPRGTRIHTRSLTFQLDIQRVHCGYKCVASSEKCDDGPFHLHFAVSLQEQEPHIYEESEYSSIKAVARLSGARMDNQFLRNHKVSR